jgi:hypothetical protein
MENLLFAEYKKITDELKSRSEKGEKISLTKDQFLNIIFEKTDKTVFDNILKEYTPKEYFIKEAIKKDLKLRDKFYDLIDQGM